MYSHEDRLRAVQLYIKLGKRVGLTIRQLGYPTKNALGVGIGSTSSTSICQPATRARRSTRRRSKNGRSITTWRMAAALRRRSGRWAIPVGNCLSSGCRRGVRIRARASWDDLGSCPRRRSNPQSSPCARGKPARSPWRKKSAYAGNPVQLEASAARQRTFRPHDAQT